METIVFLFSAFLFCFIGYLLGSFLFGQIFAKLKKTNLRDVGSKNIGATNSFRHLGFVLGMVILLLDFFKSWFATFLSLVFYNIITKGYDLMLVSKWAFLIYLGGFFAIFGHIFPITYFFALCKNKFQFSACKHLIGGKGISALAGFISAISPWMFFIIMVVFFFFLFWKRYVSLASLITTLIIPIFPLIPQLSYLYMFLIEGLKIQHSVSSSFYNFFDENTLFLNYQKGWYLIIFFFTLFVICVTLVFFRHKENIYRLKHNIEHKFF